MTKNNILDRLVTECPFPAVFQDTERMGDGISNIPWLKIGHIRADYNGRDRKSVV